MSPLDLRLEIFRELYLRHPRAAEQLRSALIEYAIATAPLKKQPRLRGLQFKIDMQRRKSQTALGAANHLSTMMFDSLVHLQEQLQRLLALLNNKSEEQKPKQAVSATIIPFVQNLQEEKNSS